MTWARTSFQNFKTTLLVAALLVGQSPVALAQSGSGALTQEDRFFLELKEAAESGQAKRAQRLAALLKAYPLQSYVDYFTLRAQVFDEKGEARPDAPDAEIQTFIAHHSGQALADRVQNDYLLVLGARHDWPRFLVEQPKFILSDDTQVQCYGLAARAAQNEKVAETTRQLLSRTRQYGSGCVALVQMVAEKGQWNATDVWEQVRSAYSSSKVDAAKQMVEALKLSRSEQKRFEQALAAPEAWLAKLNVRTVKAFDRELAQLAIISLARSNLLLAQSKMPSLKPLLTLAQWQSCWTELAYRAAFDHQPQSIAWFENAGAAPLPDLYHEWRVRAALRSQDWLRVQRFIEAMPAGLRAQPSWRYWLGRAYQKNGQPEKGQQQFARIRHRFDFYGQLAHEALGGTTRLPARTLASESEIAKMQTIAGFHRAQRLLQLGLMFEEAREWNWELRGMGDLQLLAAAEYARRVGLYDRAINTADRTHREHDFTLRYLAPFRNEVERSARSNRLDPSWAYGLIRQESRFVREARSSAGAWGLMQLMPTTAQLTARRIGLHGFSTPKITEVKTNALLGTSYLALVYSQFNNAAVGSAAYNAGPHRATKWIANLKRPIEGAIFAETIPFNETRIYVQNVLSNATYYGLLFAKGGQSTVSLTDRLGQVSAN